MRRAIAILLFAAGTTVLFSQEGDTLKRRIVRQWNLSPDFTEEVSVPVDTVFSLSNRYRLTDKFSPLNVTLGSYGLPFYQMNFFDRILDPDKFLITYYYPLTYQPSKYIFMNTHIPFTELVWTFGGVRETAEQTFRVRHSQNVNRFLNFGLIYDIVYNIGQYSYQKADDKAFTFHGSYTGQKYKAYFAVGLNDLNTNENGGILDPGQLDELEPENVAVNLGGLNQAKSYIRNRNMLLVQRYKVGYRASDQDDSTIVSQPESFRLSGTFSHIFILDANRRTFSDNDPTSGFFDSIYINKDITFDSLSARSISNTVRFDFSTDETRKFRLGGGVGIRNELLRYSQIVPTHDTLMADTAMWRKHNNSLVGKLYNNIGDNFRWIATGELFLSGYRAGDFSISGTITKSFSWQKGTAAWEINGSVNNRQPSFWYEQWGSNNFEWQNNMNKEFRVDLGTSFLYPARKTEMRFNYALIDNYTDFDTLALPYQHTGGLSVASLFLSKDFRAWKFHLTTDLLVQKSSNEEILDLPFVTVRSAGYFEHEFIFEKTNGQLNTQIGAEITLHTPYYPYAYMPATGRFFRQDQEEIGNYPFINVFLNLKLRRTRIFLMFDHVNSGLAGYNYFMVPTYPMNIRMFRYGIAWTFYD